MAIIVEEEKTSSGIISFLGWASIIAILLVAAYYAFFGPVPTVVVAPPPGLQNLASISSADLNPQGIVQGSQFQSLKQHVPPPSATGPAGVGRSNPFVAPLDKTNVASCFWGSAFRPSGRPPLPFRLLGGARRGPAYSSV
jgi:hypothetical protein